MSEQSAFDGALSGNTHRVKLALHKANGVVGVASRAGGVQQIDKGLN
jgi:hypothetical protein